MTHYAGNIVSIEETKPRTILPPPGFDDNTHWALTPTQTTTNTLSYTNSQWGDLLTSYNGTAITYDGIGNPLSYYNGTSYTFTWDGRRLTSAVTSSKTMSFSYNDEGIRTSKTVNGVTTTYYVNGGQIIAESNNSRTIVYIYDATGSPIGMMYRTPSYAANTFDVFWYEKNLQGDVVAVYNSSGQKCITYKYDAWGNFTATASLTTGSNINAIANPFRYRSYYYDTDLGMYYLQSRYYDAKICRFVNADSALYHSMLGYNMFAYCENNPVNYIDPTGESAILAAEAAKNLWWLIFVDGALPIGDIVFWTIISTLIIIEVSEIIRMASDNTSTDDNDNSLGKDENTAKYPDLSGTPGEIKQNGDKETHMGSDGKADKQRHHTTHGKPKKHSNPHDHIITWNSDGTPNFSKPHNYWDGDIPVFP